MPIKSEKNNEQTNHWRVQRITAAALVPFGLWFMISVIRLGPAVYTDVREWLASPFVGVGMALFMGIAFYHAYLGLGSIYDDYIPRERHKKTAILLTGIVFLISALIGVGAILSLSF